MVAGSTDRQVRAISAALVMSIIESDRPMRDKLAALLQDADFGTQEAA